MTTDYIKRIQSNLSRKNIKLSKPAIREEVEQLGYSNETLTDDLAVSVLNKLVVKFSGETGNVTKIQEIESFQNSELCHKVAGTNLENDSISDSLAESSADLNHAGRLETGSQNVSESEQELILDKSEPEQEIILDKFQAEELILDKCEAEELILDKLSDSTQTPETGIVVSESEKHDLITAQSSILDVQLSELETVELCSRIPDVFDDYKSFVGSVTGAIKAFVDDKFDHQETSTVDDSISELRQHIAARQARLDTKFSQGLSEVKGDLEQIRSNIKSRQTAILERFRIPAKT